MSDVRAVIAEDLDSLRFLYVNMLRGYGVRDVEECTSAEELIERAGPDVSLVVTDVNMVDPQNPTSKSGVDAVRKLRQQGFAGYIVVMSTDEEKETQALEAGADDFVQKTGSLADFQRVYDRFLKSKRT